MVSEVIYDWNFLFEALKKRGLPFTLTNGCFDILHVGHVRYLREAKNLEPLLVVALNSDASVQRLKGATRPINKVDDRAEVLVALECVDYVTAFEEDTPLALIEFLKPNTLVKGGDWDTSQIVGSEIVRKNGGRVLSLSYHDGYSSTNILNAMT